MKIKWIAIGIVFVGALLTFFIQDRGFKEESQHSFDSMFRVGQMQHYKFRYYTKFDQNTSVYQISNDIQMDAQLNMRVLQKQGDRFFIGFEFSDVTLSFGNTYLEKKMKALYTMFFIIEADANGRFLAYHFPRNRKNIRGFFRVLTMLQIIYKPSAIYTLKESDVEGNTYEALYTNREDILYKTCNDYKIPEGNLSLMIQNSSQEAILDDHSWLESLKGSEEVITLDQDSVILKNRNTLYLKKLNTPIDRSLQIWNEKRTIKEILSDFQKSALSDKKSWKNTKKEYLKKSIEKNKITLQKLLDGLHDKHNRTSLKNLKLYLQLNPDQIDQLYDFIINADDKTADMLINVLELLDMPAAQELLLKIADDLAISEDNRYKAIISLGFQKNLSQDMANRMMDMCVNYNSNENRTYESTIVLALGNIVSHTKDQDTAANIDSFLRNTFERSSNREKIAILYAFENSGVSKFKKSLMEAANSDDVELQATSLKLLGTLKNDQEVEDVLYSKMVESPSEAVKISAIKGLENFDNDKKVVDYITTQVKDLPNSRVKNEMIMLLADKVDKYPQNKEVLQGLLKDVNDERTLKTIIKSIRSK